MGEPLLKEHGKRPAEVIAIFVHELGHIKERHVLKSFVVDSFYMGIYGLVLTAFINQPMLLTSMGFP